MSYAFNVSYFIESFQKLIKSFSIFCYITLLVVHQTKVSVINQVVFLAMKLHRLVFFKSVHQWVQACFFIAQYCLVCKQHDFFKKLFFAIDLFEFFCYDDKDTEIVLFHLGFELLDYFFKTVVFDEFVDRNVDRRDSNSISLVFWFNVIKCLVIFYQVVLAAKL